MESYFGDFSSTIKTRPAWVRFLILEAKNTETFVTNFTKLGPQRGRVEISK
jgi:predicted restriction endonuclease